MLFYVRSIYWTDFTCATTSNVSWTSQYCYRMGVRVKRTDEELNPGPVKNPCSMCKRAVARTHRSLKCSTCKDLCHIGRNCGNVQNQDFINIKGQRSGYSWSCPSCLGLRQQQQQLQHNILLNQAAPERINDYSHYDTLKSQLEEGGKRSLKVAHINVNQIMTRNKLMEVKILLAETGIDILGITESKLHPKEHEDREIAIDGYKFERQDRQQGGGGGCLLYYKTHLNIVPYNVKNVKTKQNPSGLRTSCICKESY